MRKKLILMALPVVMLLTQVQPVRAEDFAGNEDYYRNLCAKPQESAADVQTCVNYKNYLIGKSDDLSNDIASLDQKLASLKGNMDGLMAVISDIDNKLASIETDIVSSEALINTIQENVITLQDTIVEKEEDIEERDALVKTRMQNEQVNIGINQYIDFIMGAEDLMSLVRIVEGLSVITEYDQDLIKTLAEEREQLKLDKEEQIRLEQEAEDQKAELEKSKQNQQALKAQQEVALAQFQGEQTELIATKRSMQVDSDTLANNITHVNPELVQEPEDNPDTGGGGGGTTGGFLWPVGNSYLNEGTWYYRSGYVHLGADFAAGIGNSIYAPSDGYILATYNGCSNGYSSCGYVLGTGNMVHMLTKMDGVTYAMSFFHQTPGGPQVSAGQYVSAGQLIGLVGNSGWSEGPHTHIEVFRLGEISWSEATRRFQSGYYGYPGDISWGSGWSSPGSGTRIKPESVF